FRRVLIAGDFAVKIAKNGEGVCCNKREAERSPLNERFCPVLRCSDDGRVLVMARADAIGDAEFERLKRSPEMKDLMDYDPRKPTHGVEYNGRNIGRRHGRLYIIDYGNEE